MSAQTVSDWKNPASVSESDPAGSGFGELSLSELRQDRLAAMASSGYICTLTWECNC